MRADPDIELTLELPHLQVRSIGEGGIVIALDDGRDDVWPAAHLHREDAEALRNWLADKLGPAEMAEPEFATRLAEEFEGKPRALLKKLARHVGVPTMTIIRWRTAWDSPRPEEAEEIAKFFGWPVNETMVALDNQISRKARIRAGILE
jgi:hypothetical protein